MYIPTTHKFIFIHIPKCAGTTVENFFNTYVCGNIGHARKPYLMGRTKKLIDCVNQNPDAFIFTFVRNPYDRFISYYLHGLRIAKHIQKDQSKKERLERKTKNIVPLYELLEKIEKTGSVYSNLQECLEITAQIMPLKEQEIVEKKIRFVDYYGYHCLPQKFFLPDHHPENWMGCKRKNSVPCSFIGRVESFDQDFSHIQTILGLPNSPADPYNVSENPSHIIKTQSVEELPSTHVIRAPNIQANPAQRRGHYSSYYNKTTRRMLEELYAEDLEILAYEYEDPNTIQIALPPLYDWEQVQKKYPSPINSRYSRLLRFFIIFSCIFRIWQQRSRRRIKNDLSKIKKLIFNKQS